MDDKDQKLLRLLSANARESVSSLAKKLNLGRTTVQARIEKLERNGVIDGYTVLLNVPESQLRVRATSLLRLDANVSDQVIKRLEGRPEIERATALSGRYDLLLQIAAPSIGELDEFLDGIGSIPGVLQTESLIHLSEKISRS